METLESRRPPLAFFITGAAITYAIAAAIEVSHGAFSAADPIPLILCATHGVLSSFCRRWRQFAIMWVFVCVFISGAAMFDARLAAAGLFLAPAGGFVMGHILQPQEVHDHD